MTNKIMRIRGNRQGRGEGRQEKHSFSKMQTAKRRRRAAGNYFYKKCRKKLSIDARGGTIESFFLQKIKKIQKNTAARKGRQHPLLSGEGHSICCRIVKQAVVFLLQSLDHVVGVFVVGRRDA